MRHKRTTNKRVLIGLSGGIDSAVSAYLLLKAGYTVEGVFMKNWSETAGLKVQDCPWLADRQDALRVAAFLDIPLHTIDFEKQYAAKVMKYFFTEYKSGRTPNPDVMCNKEIKFGLLYDWAMKKGFDYLATGHYARIVNSGQLLVGSKNKRLKIHDSRFTLLRSVDEFKDQTYFIYNIEHEQLVHLLFPIGGMKKDEVKKLAKKIGLPNAERRESMGLCFVGKVLLKDFLAQKLKAKSGSIVDMSGKKLGRHHGLHNFTIGQRQGIAVGSSGPYFVVHKDLKKNILFVTQDPHDPALETREIVLHSVHWIYLPASSSQLTASSQMQKKSSKLAPRSYKLFARYRHQGKLEPVTVELLSKQRARVSFKTPQYSLASGQSVVLYAGKACVGGGIIE